MSALHYLALATCNGPGGLWIGGLSPPFISPSPLFAPRDKPPAGSRSNNLTARLTTPNNPRVVS
jgi:hypothetical protein